MYSICYCISYSIFFAAVTLANAENKAHLLAPQNMESSSGCYLAFKGLLLVMGNFLSSRLLLLAVCDVHTQDMCALLLMDA